MTLSVTLDEWCRKDKGTHTESICLRGKFVARLEEVGERENGRARGRHARGVSFSRARFFCKRLLCSLVSLHLTLRHTSVPFRSSLFRCCEHDQFCFPESVRFSGFVNGRRKLPLRFVPWSSPKHSIGLYWSASSSILLC